MKLLFRNFRFWFWDRAEWTTFWLHDWVSDRQRDIKMEYYLDPEEE